MRNIKYTLGSLIGSFLYFVLMDIYYYSIGMYSGFYGSMLEALIGGQKFAIENSYLKMLLIPITLDLILFIRKRTAAKYYENKIVGNR